MKCALLAAWLVSPAVAQVIAGGVVNRATGEPVAQVRLRLHGKTDRFAVTDAGGRFEFTGVQPDRYSLIGERAGFLSEIRTIALPAGAGLPDLRFPLVPQAVISGVVVDADGWPVRAATVQARLAGSGPDSPSLSVAYTDDLGQFRVSKLPAGNYYLRVSPYNLRNWDDRYADATYPAMGVSGAQPLALSAGQELGGLAIRLSNPEGVTVQGRINLPSGTRLPRGFALFPNLASDTSGDRYGCTSCKPEGVFVYRHVLPGSYWLRVDQLPAGHEDWAYWSAAVMKVEVGQVDLNGLEMTLAPEDPHELRGSVAFDGPSLPAPAELVLMRLDLPHPRGVRRSRPEGGGSFLIEGIPAGRYRIDVVPPSLLGPWPWGVIARMGETDLPGGEFAFDGAATPLRIQLVSATASLSVQVTGAGGRGVWDAAIRVEPVNPALRMKAGGATDQNGDYEGSVPPGEYRVWAEAEGAGAAPAQTVVLAAGANPPLRFEFAGRAAF
jgi:hypothetical protein